MLLNINSAYDNFLKRNVDSTAQSIKELMQGSVDCQVTLMDVIVSLSGNHVQSVADASGSQLWNGSFDFKKANSSGTTPEYAYDGNMTKDFNSGITQ